MQAIILSSRIFSERENCAPTVAARFRAVLTVPIPPAGMPPRRPGAPPPLFAGAGSSFMSSRKTVDTTLLLLVCITPMRSYASVSRFFSRKPTLLYVTLPA